MSVKVMAVNAGSSSLKFTGFEMPSEDVLISGVFERIGIDNSFYTIKLNGEKIRKDVELSNPDGQKSEYKGYLGKFSILYKIKINDIKQPILYDLFYVKCNENSCLKQE